MNLSNYLDSDKLALSCKALNLPGPIAAAVPNAPQDNSGIANQKIVKRDVRQQMAPQPGGYTRTPCPTERDVRLFMERHRCAANAEIMACFERGRERYENIRLSVHDPTIREIVLDFAILTAEAMGSLGQETKWFRRPTFVPSILASRLASTQTRSFGDPIDYLISEVVRLGLFRATSTHLQIAEALQDVMLFRAAQNGHQSLVAQAKRDGRFKNLFLNRDLTVAGIVSEPTATPAPQAPRGNLLPFDPPASLDLSAPPLIRVPLVRRPKTSFTRAFQPTAPVPGSALQHRTISEKAEPTPATGHQAIKVIDLCESSPTPPAIYVPSNIASRGSTSEDSFTGKSLSGVSDVSAASGDGRESLQRPGNHTHAAYRSSDWWSLMNTIDDLQALGLHRNVSFRSSPHSTGWVKDSDILGSSGVRANLTQADMLGFLIPTCAEGLLVMGNSRDIHGQAHYYFETLPQFRLLRDSLGHRAAARYDTEETENGYAGSMDTGPDAERDVRPKPPLKRSAGLGQLPGHKDKRPARTISDRPSASLAGWLMRVSSDEDSE
ncbi:hypothetical protein QFC20_002112 [Naganishia adeliensis]|uniref:Uncharacterized protein n=1 Tax=Naganishia adeliensis TaxID=92952 RepID=A0ACC2WNP0_9TREE|nr:hypothetical protein QFC20_002112 [Naganishia adeliensis]